MNSLQYFILQKKFKFGQSVLVFIATEEISWCNYGSQQIKNHVLALMGVGVWRRIPCFSAVTIFKVLSSNISFDANTAPEDRSCWHNKCLRVFLAQF